MPALLKDVGIASRRLFHLLHGMRPSLADTLGSQSDRVEETVGGIAAAMPLLVSGMGQVLRHQADTEKKAEAAQADAKAAREEVADIKALLGATKLAECAGRGLVAQIRAGGRGVGVAVEAGTGISLLPNEGDASIPPQAARPGGRRPGKRAACGGRGGGAGVSCCALWGAWLLPPCWSVPCVRPSLCAAHRDNSLQQPQLVHPPLPNNPGGWTSTARGRCAPSCGSSREQAAARAHGTIGLGTGSRWVACGAGVLAVV